MKTKRIIINVKPISRRSKEVFDDKMQKLHGCYVNSIDFDSMNVTSINLNHRFTINRPTDSDWEII